MPYKGYSFEYAAWYPDDRKGAGSLTDEMHIQCARLAGYDPSSPDVMHEYQVCQRAAIADVYKGLAKKRGGYQLDPVNKKVIKIMATPTTQDLLNAISGISKDVAAIGNKTDAIVNTTAKTNQTVSTVDTKLTAGDASKTNWMPLIIGGGLFVLFWKKIFY